MDESAKTSSTPLALSVLDQVVWTASNVLLNVLVARSVTDVAFGKFSVGYLCVTIVIIVGVAATVETLNANEGIRQDSSRLYWACRSIGSRFVLAVMLLGALGGWAISNLEGYGLAALLIVGLPIFLAQEAARSLGLALGEFRVVLFADVGWLAIQLLGFFGLRNFWSDATAASVAWMVGALVSFAFLHLSLRASFPERPADLSNEFSPRDSLFNAADYFLAGGSTLIVTLLVGALASEGELAEVRTLQIAFGPVNMTIAAMRLVGVRFVKHSNPLRSEAMLLVLLAWVVTLAIVVGVPDRFGEVAFGDSWATTSWIILAVAGARLGAVMMVWPALRLRVAGNFAWLTKIRVASLALLSAIAVVMYMVVGARSVLGLALAGVTVLPMLGAWAAALKTGVDRQ